MSTTAAPPSLLTLTLRLAEAGASRRTRRALVLALVLSLAVHLAFTLWSRDEAPTPDAIPLTATLTELPPPPKPSVAPQPPAAKPKPKPKRAAPSPVAPPAPDAAALADAPDASSPAAASAGAPVGPAADATPAPAAEITAGAATSGKTLPPRIDLAFKVFFGTHGFLIGDAVYRFEHANNRYRIVTVGEARGLAALVLRGQGKLESRGLITDDGLQPQLLRIERGGPDRVETAAFDWEAGIVTMHDNKTEALDLPTFDPLSLMWQYYFTPPTSDVVTVTVATPRRLVRYTLTREGTDTVEWSQGPIEAERWHRTSEDGKTDAYLWLAPSLRHLPVKMRVSNTVRGTVEVVLDGIRVDENAQVGAGGELALPKASDLAPAQRADTVPGYDEARPAATFPQMTGQ